MAKATGTTKTSSSSSPKGLTVGGVKASILNGFEEGLKMMASESYEKVKSMTDAQRAEIPFSMSRAMDYTVAVRMSKERNDLIDVANKKGLWSGIHTKDSKDGALESGVINTFAGGPQIELSGMNVAVGVKVVGRTRSAKEVAIRGAGGMRYSETIKKTSKTKTYNIYKDKSAIRDLINLLKKLPSK